MVILLIKLSFDIRIKKNDSVVSFNLFHQRLIKETTVT